MWSGCSSSQQNEEGCEMASSRKAKNQAPPTAAANRPRGGTYSADDLEMELGRAEDLIMLMTRRIAAG